MKSAWLAVKITGKNVERSAMWPFDLVEIWFPVSWGDHFVPPFSESPHSEPGTLDEVDNGPNTSDEGE